MDLKSMLGLVWGRYGLIGAVVLVAVMIVLDQMYDIGLGDLVRGVLGQ